MYRVFGTVYVLAISSLAGPHFVTFNLCLTLIVCFSMLDCVIFDVGLVMLLSPASENSELI